MLFRSASGSGRASRPRRKRCGSGSDLAELAVLEVVDARLASADDEVDTLGGLVFLLAGHIPAKGESFLHPSGWRLETIDSDPRRIVRVRLHASETSLEREPSGK